MTEIVSFGEWIQKRRSQLRYTRKGLAELVACSPVTIKKIERDERRPSPEIAALLAQHLQLPESEREKFMARARGEFVSNLLSPAELSLEEAQAPAVATDAPKHNLPPQPTPFLGRKQELADIGSKIADPNCRLLTILGAGGMGKTRLSIEVAREQIGNFTDGITYVELAPIRPVESSKERNPLVSALAEALNIGFYERGEPEQQLFDYLQRKEQLLVFDNFEHLLETAVFLSNLLNHAPELKIVVTSRERLNLQEEWLFPLRGLSYQQTVLPLEQGNDDAVQLFVQRAKQVHPSFNEAAELEGLQQICQLVEGMPLGLELAAAWVTQLSCQEIAEEIKEELDFLSSEMRNIPDRHRSVRAAFSHSWEKLSQKERDVLKKLSVFRGGFERKGAKEVAGASLPTLSKLVSKSLLSVGENGRYQIHELLRQFAAERLAHNSAMQAAVQRHHGHYYLKFIAGQSINIPGNTELTQFTNIEREIDNIRSAIQYSLLQAPDLFLDEGVWEVIAIFFEARGLVQEGENLTQAIADAIRPHCFPQQPQGGSLISPACRFLSLYLMANGSYKRRLRHFDQAQEMLELACQILPRNDPNYSLEWACSHYYLAYIAFGKHSAFGTNDHLAAESHFKQAIELLRDSERQDYVVVRLFALCLVIYGQLMYWLGDFQKAERLITEGYEIVEQYNDKGALAALTLLYKGDLARIHGEYTQSEQLLKSALEIIKPLQYPSTQNMILRAMAETVGLQGRLSEAHEYIQAHNKLAMDANLPVETNFGQRRLGAIFVYAERFETAMQIFQAMPSSQRPTQTNYIGWAHLGLGKVAEAEDIFRQTLRVMFRTTNKLAGTEALAGIAFVKAQNGQLKEALTYLALVKDHPSTEFRVKQKAVKLWNELVAELPAAMVAEAEAHGKVLDLFKAAESLLAEETPS